MKVEEDVVVVGAGVVGAAIARELTSFCCRVLVIEKEEDVCSGTSKANSGIVHAGFDAEPGTWKARMNVKGSEMMEELSKQLDFPFRRNGSLVLCFSPEDIPRLEALCRRSKINGVKGCRILDQGRLRRLEPEVGERAVAALYAPMGGIVCPFGLTIALAENAADNGARFLFNTRVERISRRETGYEVITDSGVIFTRYVVNAAGVYADVLHNMVSSQKLHITPRKGEYLLLDKRAGQLVNSTIFQLPEEWGKGVLVTPTVHGNLLVGPTAEDQEDRENTETSGQGLAEAAAKASLSVKELPLRETITSFAGLRAHEDGGDFVIGEARGAEGFYDAAGIESPGLTCAPALGKYLAELIARKGGYAKRQDFQGRRRGIVRPTELDQEERNALIRKNPSYGRIICRCEEVSEGEIIDAIDRTLGARSMDGIKRRVRQGMGRCQAGFCSPAAMEILSRQTGIPMDQITKNRQGSELIRN